MAALGRRIGAVYHDALRKLHGLLDGEKQDTIREAVRALKEESIQALVALGREREQLKDRKAVDDSLAREVQRTPFADFKALTAAVRSYRSSDNDFANLLASFNTLTQYACFELLQKQNPDEAARLKISAGDAAAASAVAVAVAAAAVPPPVRLQKYQSLPGDGTGFASARNDDLDPSAFAQAIARHRAEAETLAARVRARADGSDAQPHPTRDVEARVATANGLGGCLVVGHTNTDADSVASAVGVARLYGGQATRSERELNGEIMYALEFSGVPMPPYFDDVAGAGDPHDPRGICLVDHQEPGQIVPSVGRVAFPTPEAARAATPEAVAATLAMRARIKGVIDHHALSKGFATAAPTFVDIRPWGSACSIVAHHYVRLGRPLPRPVARVLLCGVLSDTVNLTSPTTTDADRLVATLLAFLGDVEHPNELAKAMFKAKTAYLTRLSPFAIVRADQKNYTLGGSGDAAVRVGWATVEVNDPQAILDKSDALLLELRALKKEKNLRLAFLSVVDLVNKRTDLLCCGAGEAALAREVFGGATRMPLPELRRFTEVCLSPKHDGGGGGGYTLDQACMDLGNRVSRKKQFIPPVKARLASGWASPAGGGGGAGAVADGGADGGDGEILPEVTTQHICTDKGCTLRRQFSSTLQATPSMSLADFVKMCEGK